MTVFKKELRLATISRKVMSYFLDALILLLITVAINFASIAVLETTPDYQNKREVVSSTIDEIYTLEEEIRFIDRRDLNNQEVSSPISQNEMFQKWLVRHLIHSYNQGDKTVFDSISEIKDYELEYGEASLNNDYLAYFYVEFLPNHKGQGMNDISLSGDEFFKNNILNVKLTNHDIFYFDDSGFYTMNQNYAKDIYEYIYLNENDDNAYNALKALNTFFLDTLENTATIYQNYIPFKELFNQYQINYQSLISASVLTEFILYCISSVLYLLIVPLCLKNRTLSNLILRILPYDLDEKKIKPHTNIFKFIVWFCELFWISLIVSFFTIGMDGMTYTLFSIGALPINLLGFVIVSMIIAAISVLIGIARQDKRTLPELVSHTVYMEYQKVQTWDHIPSECQETYSELEKKEN